MYNFPHPSVYKIILVGLFVEDVRSCGGLFIVNIFWKEEKVLQMRTFEVFVEGWV